MKATIKTGDSFALPVQFYDTATGEGLNITNDMIITAEIVNSSAQNIATPTIIKLDQSIHAGMIVLEVPASITKLWKVGTAQLDIKLQMNDAIRHSQNIQFLIERSITR